MNNRFISIKSFQVEGDLFYTEAIRFYCNKTGTEYVSSYEEIDMLETKVRQLIKHDNQCLISSKVDKEKLITNYFTSLRLELRSGDRAKSSSCGNVGKE